MRFLLLRLEAPLMAFGEVVVDQHGPTQDHPGLSLITGLLANALGYEHGEHHRLQRLQERIRFGVREDVRGRTLRDYQTVDLGQDFLKSGWTTRHHLAGRGGGASAQTGTHIRYRHYLADAAYTIALFLDPLDEAPTLDEVGAALLAPKRPLFLGRKPCLPAVPIHAGEIDAESDLDALKRAPAHQRTPAGTRLRFWLPSTAKDANPRRGVVPVYDQRDWKNQVHVGRRFVELRLLELPGEP